MSPMLSFHLELVHVQRVIQQLVRRLRRHGNVTCVRRVAHQLQVALELFDQLFAG